MTASLALPQRFGAVSSRVVTSKKEVLAMVGMYRHTKHALVVDDFKFRPGFIYNTVRAISARINQNYDAWPSQELIKSYRTFLGKPCFVNHHNEDPRKARGRVIAARYIEKGADKYVEVIQEIDAKRFPILAHEIITGGMDAVSMGVEAGFTICSICENKATDIFDMCSHVKFHKGEHIRNARTGSRDLVYEKCYKLGFFELSYVFDPADETAVVSRVISAAAGRKPWDNRPNFTGPQSRDDYENHGPRHWVDIQRGDTPDEPPSPEEFELTGQRRYASRRHGYGETEAPEDIDTLRDDSREERGEGDWKRDPFHHWIESPSELQDPDTDRAHQLDRNQEDQGLDSDRKVEDVEEYGATATSGPDARYADPHEDDDPPAMPINPPAPRKGRRMSNRGDLMGRRRYYAAEDEGDTGGDDGGGGQEDPEALVDEAEQDLADYDAQQQSEGSEGEGDDYEDQGEDEGLPWDDDGSETDDGSDESGGDSDDGEDSDEGGDEGGSDEPPWLQDNREARRRASRPVKKRGTRGKKRAPQGGRMPRQTLATRQATAQQYGNKPRRHFQADDNGYTDGGPYGVDDSQGMQEDVFISEVPSAEAVDMPADDEGNISNTPETLVASRGVFDPQHYQRLADVVSALPPEQRHDMAHKMAVAMKSDNPRFNWRTFYTAARVPVPRTGSRRTAEDLVDPDKVDPPLPDTGASDIKGDEFESLALDDVETQPKDASIHAFGKFDQWLAQVTGRTASQHANANFIRRAAVTYAKRHRNAEAALQSLFPTLEYILHEARKVEGRKANMNRYADESLDVAAPDGRVDVEAPVKNVTDELAQSSQFDLGDFGNNAGDDLADPVLDPVDGNAGTWAPDQGKEASVKLASGTEAVRLADAYIKAMPGKYKEGHRWQLTARFETLRQPVVRDRIRLLEAVIEENRTARRVTAGRSRGTTNGTIPRNFGSGPRTAGRGSGGADDPTMDAAIFF